MGAKETDMGFSAVTGESRGRFPGWNTLFVLIGLYVFLSILSALMIALTLWLGYGQNPLNGMDLSEARWLVPLNQLITFVPIIAWLISRRRRYGLSAMGPGLALGRMNPGMILYGFAAILAAGVVIEPILKALPDTGMAQLDTIISGGWGILSAVVIAPIVEETLFRGLILDSVRTRFGAFWAVIVSALIFGAFHGLPQQAFNAMVVGLFLGYIYVRTSSLGAVILIHMLNNALSCILTGFGISSDTYLSDMIHNRTIWLIVWGICAAFFIFAMVMLVINLRRARIIEPVQADVDESETVNETESVPEPEETIPVLSETEAEAVAGQADADSGEEA